MSNYEGFDLLDQKANVPLIAGWLGGLGAVPFIGLAGAIPFLTDPTKILIIYALVAYGAVILSFLGGVHWGLAIGAQRGSARAMLHFRLPLSVIPSLIGWTALLIGGRKGLIVLAGAIVAMLWVDIWATKQDQAPLWYPKLRITLSLVVTSALLLAAMT
jgi:hypothetical protein